MHPARLINLFIFSEHKGKLIKLFEVLEIEMSSELPFSLLIESRCS